jgi:hypothetical protein
VSANRWAWRAKLAAGQVAEAFLGGRRINAEERGRCSFVLNQFLFFFLIDGRFGGEKEQEQA